MEIMIGILLLVCAFQILIIPADQITGFNRYNLKAKKGIKIIGLLLSISSGLLIILSKQVLSFLGLNMSNILFVPIVIVLDLVIGACWIYLYIRNKQIK